MGSKSSKDVDPSYNILKPPNPSPNFHKSPPPYDSTSDDPTRSEHKALSLNDPPPHLNSLTIYKSKTEYDQLLELELVELVSDVKIEELLHEKADIGNAIIKEKETWDYKYGRAKLDYYIIPREWGRILLGWWAGYGYERAATSTIAAGVLRREDFGGFD